ncbi:MAG: ATP-dependent protease ATPase subunit HslU [Planctomycetota bacterium]
MVDRKILALEDNLTPKMIVAELNKYIIGQEEAKKAVAIAVRNRFRRQQLPPELRDEIAPKNILMIGPTGVGKTEIARRLSQLVRAPFLKVEATKYTEIGYYGRNVDSMIRDLVEIAIGMVKRYESEKISKSISKIVEERILDLILPHSKKRNNLPADEKERIKEARALLKEKLQHGQLEDKTVEIEVEEKPMAFVQAFTPGGLEEMGFDLPDMFSNLFPSRKKTKSVPIKEARKLIELQETEKQLDKGKIIEDALFLAQNHGIIFIDEIDKIVGSGKTTGPDVSREGVQRDLLPIIEGCSVSTRYGIVKTDHILFICAGAFSQSKPSDLIPELQGRLPIRVELKSLKKEDFLRILTQPKNALLLQYKALLQVEGIELEYTKEAVEKIAEYAEFVNNTTQDIGARRLHTITEKLLEDYLFEAPDMKEKKIIIDAQTVVDKLQNLIEKEDLRQYML